MSRISDRIRNILKYADSSRVTDKKKCVSELLEIYQNEEAIKEISRNTEEKTPGIVNWPYIMYIVHKLVVDEAKRPCKETSGARKNDRYAINGLVINTVRESNGRSAQLLKSSEIIPRILQILDSEIYVHYRDTYLGILVTYILPKNANRTNIAAEQWRELLLICRTLYERPHVKKHVVLDALRMIVEYSFLHANILLDVKSLLLFLGNIFKDAKANDEQLAESFYKLSNIVYKQIATESRITLCYFSENILPDVLCLCASDEKYKLLLTFLQIHHPDGTSSCEDGAYAYDWNKWKDLVNSMCLLIHDNCKSDVQWTSFVEFASEVIKQMMEDSNNFVSPSDDSSNFQPKRRRTINKMQHIVDLVTESNPEQVWPLIRILTETLRKYPQCMKPQDIAPLLQRLTELARSRDESVMDNVYELAAVLIERETSIGEAQDTSIHWTKIWDMLLRSLGANQNEESGHALIRCFIKCNKIFNSDSFLRLYVTKAIRWSPNSVRTLLQLCKRISLPENASIIDPSFSTTPFYDRTHLLEWLLNAPWHELATRLPIQDLCDLSTNIVLSSRRQTLRTNLPQDPYSQTCSQDPRQIRGVNYKPRDIHSTDLPGLCHSFLAFKMTLLPNSKEKCEKQDSMVNGSRVYYVKETLDFLKKRLYDIIEEGSCEDDVDVLLTKVALLAKLFSNLRQLGILTEDIARCPFIATMEKCLKHSFEVIARIDLARRKYMYVTKVITALSVLYGTTYDADIARIIVLASTVNMLKNIFDLLNLDDTQTADYRSNSDYYEEHGALQERRKRFGAPEMSSNLTREGVIRFRVVEALTSFCAMYIGENKSELQTKMMRNLLTVQQDFVDFGMSLMILQSLARCDQDEVHRNYKDAPLQFLLHICQKDQKDERSLRKLLTLLPVFFEYANKYSYSSEKIVQTLSILYEYIHQRNCSILVHSEYMNCVCSIIRIDPDFSWNDGGSENVAAILNSLLDYINNSLFVLRSEAVRCLQQLMSLKSVLYKWTEHIFVKVEKTVLMLFDVAQELHPVSQNILEECQREDERETRTATALIALASVMCANGVLQGLALRVMLQLTAKKELEIRKVRKILSAVMQQTKHMTLIEDNLNYLLTYWISANYSLQDFPWQLTGCETIDEFFSKHINRLVPILFRTSHLDQVISFCTNIHLSFDNVFEDVFPTCFVWLISRTCDQTSSPTDSIAKQTLNKLLSNSNEFTSMRRFYRLFTDRLKDILVELLQRLHDELHFEHMFTIVASFPELEPPHFSKIMVDRCFSYIERCFLQKPLTHVLVEQQPEALQAILLQLTGAVYSSQSSESKLKRLHQYAYFCSMMMHDLEKPFFDEMSAFLIRDICYSLLHLARNDNGIFSTMCCKFLDLFLKKVLPTRSVEVKDILRFIVTNLIDLVQIASTTEVPLDLLGFLIIEQKDVLREAIAKLGSFPNLDIFQNIRNACNAIRYKDEAIRLEDELEQFLDIMHEENAECTLEDLMNLAHLLSIKKKELKELHRRSERPNFEDTVSILHLLIFKLVKLTESPNGHISIEATKCLGEVGPIDSSIALRPARNLFSEAEHAIDILTYRSLVMLTNFLVQDEMDLRKVSADALYAVLSTNHGRKLSDPKYSKDLSCMLDECTPLKIDYIRPFINGPFTSDSFSVDITRLRAVVDSANALWTVKIDDNYIEWIVKVTCSITECFTNSYLKSFLPVYRLSIEFCELILPRIIHLVVRTCTNFVSGICDCINHFFRYLYTIEAETSSLRKSSYDRKIVRCMLDMVNYVRTQLPDGMSLKLDYIYLAKAAHECSAYYTALLFSQLACESISMEYPDFSSDPKIDYIYAHQPEFGKILLDIMQDTYLNINDPDAMCGAGSSRLLDHDSRVQHYASTNRWDEVILMQDIKLSCGNLSTAKEMAKALHHSGLQFLQWGFLDRSKELDLERFSYECAWRLGNWDLLVSDATSHNDFAQLRLESLENVFHEYHYHALRCFHEDDQRGTERAIENARRSLICSLRVISLENSRTMNERLSQLRLLREIEQLSSANPNEYLQVLHSWDEHEILNGQFEHVEPLLRQRITMFQIKESLEADVNIQQTFFETCLDLAVIAKDRGNFPVAATALGILAKHRNLSQDLQNQLRYHESVLAWMKSDQIIARRLLRSLIEKKSLKPSLKAEVLRVYGNWMAETKSENPQTVIQKYYLESIGISETIEERTPDVIRNLHDTQVALARFADTQYEHISAYMKSPIYESLKESVEYAAKIDQAQLVKNQNVKRAVIISQKQSTNDAAELKNIEQERRNYLLLALKYYLRTLQQSEEHNLLIFRLVALWLDNVFDEDVNKLLGELDIVPSFKFVRLVPQLAAHVSNEFQKSFSSRIFELLKRCAVEHPYHTLPVILALKNLHSDDKYDSELVTKKEERRVLGAKRLLTHLTRSMVRPIIYEMEKLSEALLSLAYWQPKGKCYSGKQQQIPRDQPISKIRNLDNVLIPTLSLPVKPSGNYDNVVGVSAYRQTCEFVGGVTAPKKIICIGTDGIQHRQLVKGKDDLRQDAVMQQVFDVMNTLLRTCKETKKRKLRIRTYKVVPLTQRSGVLEWCDNTVPITTSLVGSEDTPGLHKKYYPTDLTAEVAREKMKNIAQQSNEIKLKVFLSCCKRIKPAFHHFFEERYCSPEIWVERTLTYTRSIATTSVAGYILGLGDRHLSNILIDERTAEVVHIDFGVAFEQGKVLPLPETVPFRLTRDIEVAMGVCGIEGTMRRSCEETLTMLRDQKQIIITLLQVLLYDPLFTWAITPEKACKKQSDIMESFSEAEKATVEANKFAKRALLRIEQKLGGTEDGLASSIPGQVERLLQEARDPANLCRLYSGWQPYL